MSTCFVASYIFPRRLTPSAEDVGAGYFIHSVSLDNLQDSSGLTFISAAKDPLTAYGWLYGAVPANHFAQQFECALEHGALPLHTESITCAPEPFSFVSFPRCGGTVGTFLEHLGLARELATSIRKSQQRTCSRCGRQVHLYETAQRAGEVLTNWKPRSATSSNKVLLSGGGDTTQWAEYLGYREVDPPPHYTALEHRERRWFLVDENLAGNWVTIVSILPSIWNLQSATVWIVSDESYEAVARYGTCSICGEEGHPAPGLLETPERLLSSNYSGRWIEGIEYGRLVSSPICELDLPLSSSDTIIRTMRVLQQLGCCNFSLSSSTADASKNTLQCSKAAALLCRLPLTGPLVFYEPFGYLNRSSATLLLEEIEERARSQQCVIIADSAPRDLACIEVYEEPTVTLESSPVKRMDVLPPPFSERSIVIEWLDFYDPLARTFSLSAAAKGLGLLAKDFSLGSRGKTPRYTCQSCLGLGLTLNYSEYPHQAIFVSPLEVCATCSGLRFRQPIRDITFKGITLPELLHGTFNDYRDFFRSLPRGAALIEDLIELRLGHLTLGYPVVLLSPSEIARLTVVKALTLATSSSREHAGDKTSQREVVCRLPLASLTEVQRLEVLSVLRARSYQCNTLIRLAEWT